MAFESGKEEDACSSRPLPVYLFAEPEVTWDKGQEHTTTTALVWVGGHSRRKGGGGFLSTNEYVKASLSRSV